METEKKEYNYGEGYFPTLFIRDKKIVQVKCKCVWMQVHEDAWKNGETICKHLQCSIREFDLEMKNKNKIKIKRIKQGYIMVYKPNHKYSETKNGWIFEHRSVVEDFIKRRLDGCCVHHIDENKENNKIENLMIFDNVGEHSKFHTKINQFGMTNPIKRQIENRWKKEQNHK